MQLLSGRSSVEMRLGGTGKCGYNPHDRYKLTRQIDTHFATQLGRRTLGCKAHKEDEEQSFANQTTRRRAA